MPFHGHGQCLVPETGFGKQRARRRLMGHPTLSRRRGRGLLPGMTKGEHKSRIFFTYLGNIQGRIVNVCGVQPKVYKFKEATTTSTFAH